MHPIITEDKAVQILYRKVTELPVTDQENKDFDDWLHKCGINPKAFDHLYDKQWVEEARKKYFAPGKEEGLQQLRQQIFNHKRPSWWRRWYKKILDFIVPAFDI